MVENIKHRGLDSKINRGLPNSAESFRQRFGEKIELDVFLLADGEIAVLHNADLKLSQEQVEALNLAELEKIVIPDREGEQEGLVLLFKEFAFNCLDRGNPLLIELKASTPEKARKLARKLIALILEMSKEDRTFIAHPEYLEQLELHSFSIEALLEAQKAMEENNLNLSRGLFWTSTAGKAKEMEISNTAIEFSNYHFGEDWTEKGIETAEKIGAKVVDLHWSVLDAAKINLAHRKGLKVFAWLVNDIEKVKALEELGVDGVISEK